MALTATIYTFEIDLADVDRGVYEKLDLRLARHPSETIEYMLLRLFAYCLEYADGIELTQGVSAIDEPAVVVRDLTGKVTAWIEVGMPEPTRVHRGHKLAGRVAIYTNRDARKLIAQLQAANVRRLSDIAIHAFDPAFIDAVGARIQRRSHLTLSITERELYLQVDEDSFTTTVVEHRG